MLSEGRRKEQKENDLSYVELNDTVSGQQMAYGTKLEFVPGPRTELTRYWGGMVGYSGTLRKGSGYPYGGCDGA